MNLPLLLDIILYTPGKLFDPITIFKVYPAIMYAILTISIYFLMIQISRNRLGALIAASISIFYFLNIFTHNNSLIKIKTYDLYIHSNTLDMAIHHISMFHIQLFVSILIKAMSKYV